MIIVAFEGSDDEEVYSTINIADIRSLNAIRSSTKVSQLFNMIRIYNLILIIIQFIHITSGICENIL